jgi:hypothetical protein
MSETLRQAIRDSGLSLYRVAKDSGVPYAVLHRFAAGKRAMGMDNLDKLCHFLELELRKEQEL